MLNLRGNDGSTGLLAELAKIQEINSPEQLQQMAEKYKQNPAGAPLIAALLTRSQKLKQLRSGILASDKAGSDEVPVVDEAINSMASRETPEESGIARIPAPNIANMAEGGIVAFAGGGSPREKYEQMIREEAERQGVDPEHMLRLVQAESGFDPQIVSPKKAAGLFQLMPGTARDMGITEQDRFNPSKAVPAGTRYFKQLLDKFDGDYEKATAAYNWGPNRQALAKDDWKLGLPKETAAYLTRVMPMGTAQAAPQAQGAGRDLISQIPTGGAGQGPTPAAPSNVSYFGGLADRMGIPEEYQRNISNTLSALGGFSMPAAWASKAANLASKGLEPTAEAVAKAAQLKQVAETPRLLPPAKAGLEGLSEAAQAARGTAEAARRARGVEADVQAARGAQQSVDAATKSAQIARETEAALRAKGATAGVNAAKVANVGRAVTTMQAADQALRGEGTPEEIARGTEGSRGPLSGAAWGEEAKPDELPLSEKKMIGLAKEAIPASERKGWTDDMLMQFFLSMMAGKSPNALANIGEAGLSALKYGQEAKKAELDQRKAAQDIELSKAHEKYYGAAAQRYAAEDKPLAQYTKAVDNALAQLEKNQMYAFASPAQQAAMEQQARQRVLATYVRAYPELADTILGKTGNPLVDKYLQ